MKVGKYVLAGMVILLGGCVTTEDVNQAISDNNAKYTEARLKSVEETVGKSNQALIRTQSNMEKYEQIAEDFDDLKGLAVRALNELPEQMKRMERVTNETKTQMTEIEQELSDAKVKLAKQRAALAEYFKTAASILEGVNIELEAQGEETEPSFEM